METVGVSLGERSYDIVIGSGLLSGAGERLRPLLRSTKVLVAADENAMEPHGETLVASLRAAGFSAEVQLLPPGETTKDVRHLELLWDRLSELRFGRDSAVVALGGGVAGDLVGFAAASYLRGVDFVQVPTTLLAMVDSSVGGKTGINNRFGKNLLGAFWQPRLVLADTATLETLPEGECVSALAEIIKYGVIYDAEFFAWLEENIEAVRTREERALSHAVRRSCEIKAAVVGQDERESGLREILNFGHTVGHAIENAAGYGALRHGEAIAIGMVAESRLGIGRRGWREDDHARVVRLIERAGLPIRLAEESGLSVEELLTAARSDKKTRAGAVRYMVPTRMGEVVAEKIEDAMVSPILISVGARP